MRFNFDAYNKVYPPVKEVPHEPIDSAVDTFKPTEDEIEAKKEQDVAPGGTDEPVEDVTPGESPNKEDNNNE